MSAVRAVGSAAGAARTARVALGAPMRSRSSLAEVAASKGGVTVAVAGATGSVGQDLLRILHERNFPVSELRLLASKRSAGRELKDGAGRPTVVRELREDSFEGVDVAFFAAGGSQSKAFAPAAVDAGAVVIDNSSAFRMTPGVPLVVPEVNPHAAAEHTGIIANPNCSTIIAAVPVWPLHQAAGVRRMVVSTYQAASGAGLAAMEELEQQARDWVAGKSPVTQDIFGRQYIFNVFSHNSDVDAETGYNEEETKMIKETAKIFETDAIAVSATCVRVPVLRAHCESINLTFDRPLPIDEAREILRAAPGVKIVDDRARNAFPEPLLASDQDDVLVGRLRQDNGQAAAHGIEMFVAGDQVRKGAATNAVQIAELLLKM